MVEEYVLLLHKVQLHVSALDNGHLQVIIIIIIIIIIIFINCNWVVTGGNGYFTCIQNMKLVATKFKSGGLHEKHVVATWNLWNHLSICF